VLAVSKRALWDRVSFMEPVQLKPRVSCKLRTIPKTARKQRQSCGYTHEQQHTLLTLLAGQRVAVTTTSNVDTGKLSGERNSRALCS